MDKVQSIITKNYTKDYNKGKSAPGYADYYWDVYDVHLPRDVARAYAYYRNGKRLEKILPIHGRSDFINKLEQGDDAELIEQYNKHNFASKLEDPENMNDDYYDDYITQSMTYDGKGGTISYPSIDEEGFDDYLRNGGHVATQYAFNGPESPFADRWDLMADPEYGVDNFGNSTAGKYAKAKMKALLAKQGNNKTDVGNIAKSIAAYDVGRTFDDN